MGLFSKKEITPTEPIVLQAMQNSPLIDYVIDKVRNMPEAQWIRFGKHGDSGWRKVIVYPSGFIIEVPGAYRRRDEDSFVSFNFVDCGYQALNEHKNQYGKVDITRSRMCYLYATALQNRLRTIMENCEFGAVSIERNTDNFADDNFLFLLELSLTDHGKYAEFSYRVPVASGSKLF